MALATLHPLGPLALLKRTDGSRIERRTELRSTPRRPALQLRCMGIQEQWKPPSKEPTTSRRDAIFFMTAVSLAGNTLLSADPAEAQVKTASIGQQIMEKLEVLKEMVGLSKPKSKDANDKEKAPASPPAKETTSQAKVEAPQQPPTPAAKETPKEEKPQESSATSKEEKPGPPSPLNDSPKPIVDAILPK